MSTKCCCGHGKFLHRNGICFATVNPCGCRSYQPDDGTDPVGGPIPKDDYCGRYTGRYTLEQGSA